MLDKLKIATIIGARPQFIRKRDCSDSSDWSELSDLSDVSDVSDLSEKAMLLAT